MWLVVLGSYFPVLRLGLGLSDQFIAAHFFVSHLILVLAWAFSGPGVAAVMSLLTVAVSIYVGLGVREPAFFLQILIVGGLFVTMAFYLQTVQQRVKDKQIKRERISEDLHLTRQACERKDELKRALQKKIDHFLDLERFSEELKTASSPADSAQKIVREVHLVLGKADECLLYLVDEANQDLTLLAAAPARRQSLALEKSGRIFDYWVVKRSQAVMIEDTRNDFRFADDAKPDLDDWRSVCASPLIVENKVLGVVRANSSQPRRFTADDLRLLDIFCSLGVVTLRNLLLHERMRELATRDSLTGLYVNRFFQERLDGQLRKAGKNPFAVIMLDIDHFKRCNDDYGHSAGDLVLKGIAELVGGQAGPDGLAARYGGEEFALLLPGRDKKAAMALAESLRMRIEQQTFLIRRAEKRVTASLGVAEYPADGQSKEELLKAADKHLYAAKNAGRNRICGAI